VSKLRSYVVPRSTRVSFHRRNCPFISLHFHQDARRISWEIT